MQPETTHGMGYPSRDHTSAGASILGTMHYIGHASRGHTQDTTFIQGPQHQLGQPSRDHAWDGISIQGLFTGWTTIQGPLTICNTHPGTTHGAGHPPRDHTWGGTPTQGPHMGPGPCGVGDARFLSQAPRGTAECPTPRSLFSLQDTREYEVSI